VDGHVVKETIATPNDPKSVYGQEDLHIFYFNMATNESHEITLAEATKLNLNGDLKSPEGYEVLRGGGNDFPFGGFDYNVLYMKKGSYAKRLNANENNYYSFNFLGWVNK
jgi:hypothetical protein